MRSRLAASILILLPVSVFAQGVPSAGNEKAGPARRTAKTVAPIDLTGYWVSVVTEDWRFRMVTPAKGDYASVPLNAAARAVADKWGPAKDEAEGNAWQ